MSCSKCDTCCGCRGAPIMRLKAAPAPHPPAPPREAPSQGTGVEGGEVPGRAQAVIRIIFIDMLGATLLILHHMASTAEVFGVGPAGAPTGSRVASATAGGPGGGRGYCVGLLPSSYMGHAPACTRSLTRLLTHNPTQAGTTPSVHMHTRADSYTHTRLLTPTSAHARSHTHHPALNPS